jgi:hypothetical protein
MPRPLYPPGNTRHPLYRRLDGPQGLSGGVRKISLTTGSRSLHRPVPASRYTDWAIPAPLDTRSYFLDVKRLNILHEISKRKANWIGHILRRNCLLQQVIEGKIKGGIEVTGRRGSRRRKLLDDLKERTGYSHLKEEALDRTMWRADFGRGFGPVVRQTAKWMKWLGHEVNHSPRCSSEVKN